MSVIRKTNTELVACAGQHKRNSDAISALFSDAEGDTNDYTNLPIVAFKKLKYPT